MSKYNILSGIDIVENDRIKKLIQRSPDALNDIFSKRELEYAKNKKFPEQSLGARFAAKEALLKATDSDILEYDLTKIRVINSKSRKPFLKIKIKKLNNKIKKLLKKSDFSISLSLSHEKKYSVAQVLIF